MLTGSVIGATIKNSRLADCTIVASLLDHCTLENCTVVNKLVPAPDRINTVAKVKMDTGYCALRGCYIDNSSMEEIEVRVAGRVREAPLPPTLLNIQI